jgi:hypothetical protein
LASQPAQLANSTTLVNAVVPLIRIDDRRRMLLLDTHQDRYGIWARLAASPAGIAYRLIV